MYRNHPDQLEFEAFLLPFGGKLRSDNGWVRLAKKIPWKEVEVSYRKHFSNTGMGSPAKTARIALGALIIKERLGTSDEETVEQIRENPYLQYFLGYDGYGDEVPFDPSMFVHFRKRITLEALQQLSECMVKEQIASNRDNDPTPASGSDGGEPLGESPQEPPRKGKLIIDARCAPQQISRIQQI